VVRIGKAKHNWKSYDQDGCDDTRCPDVALKPLPTEVLEKGDAGHQPDDGPGYVGRVADGLHDGGLVEVLVEEDDDIAQGHHYHHDQATPGARHFSARKIIIDVIQG